MIKILKQYAWIVYLSLWLPHFGVLLTDWKSWAMMIPTIILVQWKGWNEDEKEYLD